MPRARREESLIRLISLVCTIGFGLAPALAAARTAVMDTLRGGQGGAESGRMRAGTAMIAVQVALSVVLLVAGSLFVRSLQSALAVDTGFRSDGVATLAVGLRQHGYSPEQAAQFIRDVLEHARARPEIENAAAATRGRGRGG